MSENNQSNNQPEPEPVEVEAPELEMIFEGYSRKEDDK